MEHMIAYRNKKIAILEQEEAETEEPFSDEDKAKRIPKPVYPPILNNKNYLNYKDGCLTQLEWFNKYQMIISNEEKEALMAAMSGNEAGDELSENEENNNKNENQNENNDEITPNESDDKVSDLKESPIPKIAPSNKLRKLTEREEKEEDTEASETNDEVPKDDKKDSLSLERITQKLQNDVENEDETETQDKNKNKKKKERPPTPQEEKSLIGDDTMMGISPGTLPLLGSTELPTDNTNQPFCVCVCVFFSHYFLSFGLCFFFCEKSQL